MNLLSQLRNCKELNFGFEICSRKSETKRVKGLVRDILSGCYESEGVDRFLVAFDEILTNAYEHGAMGLSKEEKAAFSQSQKLEAELLHREALHGDRKISVELFLKDNRCLITVQDEGSGFDWQMAEPAKTVPINTTYSGRGLLLADKLVDKLTFELNPTRCSMLKHLKLLNSSQQYS